MEAGLGLLGFFAQDSDRWRLLARAGAIDAILQAAEVFENSAAILEAAYGALWQLAIDDANRELIGDRLDGDRVSQSMVRFPREEKLKKHATGLLQLMAFSEEDHTGSEMDASDTADGKQQRETQKERVHGAEEPLVVAPVADSEAATIANSADATANLGDAGRSHLNAPEKTGGSFGSDIQMDTIVEAFYVFDGDDDGTITTQEFDAVMRSL